MADASELGVQEVRTATSTDDHDLVAAEACRDDDVDVVALDLDPLGAHQLDERQVRGGGLGGVALAVGAVLTVEWAWVVWLGVAVWALGLFFEAVGDRQLAAYKARPREERPPVMDQGLWAWTRHPNYFGDACVWWGLWLAAGLASGWLPGLLTVLCPVAMTVFLRNVTGAKLLERTMSQRPGWDEYAARVPLFFPRPPRS